MANPRAYLAGPDVFLRDPMAFAERKKALCARYGIEGVFPLDEDVKRGDLPDSDFGLAISRANERLIRNCQLVIANITPFRGPSADVGTAYEMGFARALGLRIFAYTNVGADFADRTRTFVGRTAKRSNGEVEDPNQMSIESFGLVDNLMLAGAIVDSLGVLCSSEVPESERYVSLEAFEECVSAAARSFHDRS